MTGTKIPITVVVPVKNEERNLSRCLARLERFSRVVVVDSNSTDSTVAIARQHGAEVVSFTWDGKYPKKRNWYLTNHQFETEWVMFLDADELVDSDFCNAVETAIIGTRHDGFWLNYRTYFLRRRIRHGIPQRKLALMRVGKGLYERIEEDNWSGLDMEIHEHPVLEGSAGLIVAPIDHDDDQGINKYIDRHRQYALWEAQRYNMLQRSELQKSHFSARQKRKYANIGKWWFPWAYFGMTYFLKLGFLDGRAGFLFAFYKLWYFTSIRLLIKEAANSQPSSQRTIG